VCGKLGSQGACQGGLAAAAGAEQQHAPVALQALRNQLGGATGQQMVGIGSVHGTLALGA
jgi:hypothetical protein